MSVVLDTENIRKIADTKVYCEFGDQGYQSSFVVVRSAHFQLRVIFKR